MIVPSMASLRSMSVRRTSVTTRCIRFTSWRRKMLRGVNSPIFFRRSRTYRKEASSLDKNIVITNICNAPYINNLFHLDSFLIRMHNYLFYSGSSIIIIIKHYCHFQHALHVKFECSLALTHIVPIYTIKWNMANKYILYSVHTVL